MELEVSDENGDIKPATGQIGIDIKLSIGEGMPNNKVSMFNILQAISQMQMIDPSTGLPTSIISFKKVQDMLEDILGIVLSEEDEKKLIPQNSRPQPVNQDMNVPNANISGQMGGILNV